MEKKRAALGVGYLNSQQFQEEFKPLHLLRQKREEAKARGDSVMEEEYNRLFLLKKEEIEKSMLLK